MGRMVVRHDEEDVETLVLGELHQLRRRPRKGRRRRARAQNE